MLKSNISSNSLSTEKWYHLSTMFNFYIWQQMSLKSQTKNAQLPDIINFDFHTLLSNVNTKMKVGGVSVHRE